MIIGQLFLREIYGSQIGRHKNSICILVYNIVILPSFKFWLRC